MPSSWGHEFGGQTVDVVLLSNTGVAGALGTYQQAETVVAVTGCRHRPLNFDETAEYDVDISTELWKTTAPPDPTLLVVKANDILRVDGVDYRIVGGARAFTDMSGVLFKITIVSKRNVG